MPNLFALPVAAASLSLASITNDATERDWSDLYSSDSGEPGWQAVLPVVSRGAVEQYASDLWADFPKEQALYDVDGDAQVEDEDLREEFWQTDGGDEWRNSFDPMMNFGWAVDLRYTDSDELQAIAGRFAEWGLACSLIEISGGDYGEDTYEIALTGGGMNLSDHLAAAYIACGHVPPIRLLDNLSGSFPSSLIPRLPMAEVIERAADWLRTKAGHMDELSARIEADRIKKEEAGA